MGLMEKFLKLEKYLTDKEFFGDTELQNLTTKLGVECDDADTTTNDLNEALMESLNGKRRYYGEDY